MNVASLVRRTAGRYPANIAIVEDKERVPYEQLWQEIESLSNAFRSIGIRKNTRVALLLPNCKEFIYSFFALININAIAVPLKPGMTCWELAGIFKNCTPKAVILTPNLLIKILADTPSLLRNRIIIVKEGKVEIPILDKDGYLENARMHTLNALRQMGKKEKPVGRKIYTNSHHVASINYTYRGYGYPLGAMLTHANYVYGTFSYIRHRKTSSNQTHLLILPCTHIFPLIGCILAPLLVGAKVVILDNYSPKRIFHSISSNRVNILVLVPTLFSALVRNYRTYKHDISSLEYGISGGSFMSPELTRLIKEKMNIDVVQGYGLTECQAVTGNYRASNKPETLGLPFHRVQIRVVDERGKDCETGKTGEILIKTPQNMKGYYRNKRDTMRVLQDGWLRTGDYGEISKDGYVYFKGLKKNIAQVGGNVVDIEELRNRILSLDQAADVELHVQEDVVRGHKVTAEVIVNQDSDSLTVRDIRGALRESLSLHKTPGEFSILTRPK